MFISRTKSSFLAAFSKTVGIFSSQGWWIITKFGMVIIHFASILCDLKSGVPFGNSEHLWSLWTLREKCPHAKFFWSLFSRYRTECGEIRIGTLAKMPFWHFLIILNKSFQKEIPSPTVLRKHKFVTRTVDIQNIYYIFDESHHQLIF